MLHDKPPLFGDYYYEVHDLESRSVAGYIVDEELAKELQRDARYFVVEIELIHRIL